MKKSILILSTVIAYFTFSAVSCEEPEPFVNVKGIETQVYNEIKAFRESNSKTGPFVHQFVMVKEAQLFSAKLSYAAAGIDTTGIAAHWDIIHNKIGGTNDLTLIQSTTDATAAEIVANWTEDSTYKAMILGDFTQCGVGIEYGTNQVAFVTVLMMKVE